MVREEDDPQVPPAITRLYKQDPEGGKLMVINEKRCAVCDRYRCDDPDCETGCCQGHCTICGLSMIAKVCAEKCDDHCQCKEEN